MRSIGPYFTWINKTIWTRMDRAFVNALWYDVFDFSQVVYMANSLSDHSAVVIDTPKCTRPSPTFHFRDMWTRDVAFLPLVTSQLPTNLQQGPYQSLKWFLSNTRKGLLQLNKHHYADLRAQLCNARTYLERTQSLLSANPLNQELAQKENELRDHYTKILSSIIDILR